MSIAEVLPSPHLYSVFPDASPTVLIADDQPKVRDLLVKLFRELGIEITTAKDGLEALRLVCEQRPDLILLDGLLPHMSGFEAARFIRHVDASYRPRIALVTGVYKSVAYRNSAALEYGVDDYLVKPVSLQELRRLVASVEKRAARV